VRVRDRFFGNWDRGLTTVSFSATIVGTVVSVFLVAYPSAIPHYIVVRDLLFWFALILMSLIVSGKYIRREAVIRNQIDLLSSQYNLLSNQFKLSHDLVHNYRTELFYRYFQPQIQRQRFTDKELRIFRHLCSYITEGVKTSLYEYFRSKGIDIGTDLAISVKLIITPEEVLEALAQLQQLSPEQKKQIQAKDQWFITVFRDNYTHIHSPLREKGLKIYDTDNNTAFRLLVRSQAATFCCNDLQSLGIAYDNDKKDWRNYYNATLVVPIRYQSLDGTQFRCYGVLAVDSLNVMKITDLYNEVECKYILGHAADLLATFFLLLEATNHTPNNGDPVVNSAPVAN
jgi:hypothetical protein